MKRAGFLVLVAAALAACTSFYSKPAADDAQDRAAAAYTGCDAQYQAGKLKTYREAVECARPLVIAAYRENAYPFMDLVALELQEHAAGAAKADDGAATADEVRHDLAELDRRIAAEGKRRAAVFSHSGGFPDHAPVAQLVAGLPTLDGSAAAPDTGDCFAVGPLTNCSSGHPIR